MAGPAVSIRDVATQAGVSVGTVSNVLNRPDIVAALTRTRVLAAINELGFVPNDAARQLRRGRGRTLGLVVLDVANPFFTDVAKGVEDGSCRPVTCRPGWPRRAYGGASRRRTARRRSCGASWTVWRSPIGPPCGRRGASPAGTWTWCTSSGAAPATSCSASSPRTRAGCRWVAGPVEATALGNVLVQARALGVLDGGLAELRARCCAVPDRPGPTGRRSAAGPTGGRRPSAPAWPTDSSRGNGSPPIRRARGIRRMGAVHHAEQH